MEYNSQKRINNKCFNTWKMLGLTPKRNISYNCKWRSHGAKIQTFMRWEPSHSRHLAGRTLKVCPIPPHTHAPTLPRTRACTHALTPQACTCTAHMHISTHTHPTHAHPCTHIPHIHTHMHTHPTQAHPCTCMHTQLVSKTTRLNGSKHMRNPNELISKLPGKDSHAKHNRCRFTQLVQETHWTNK